MAASLAGRLQRPHHEVVLAHKCVLNKECGGSKRSSRVRLHAALWGRPNGGLLESRGRSCKSTTLFSTSLPRREALVFAMSENESDITDMQELADGSLFFSFGGSLPPLRNSNKSSVQPRAKHHELKMEMGSHNLKPADIPHRFPSSFHKMSPIPSVRKKANSSKGMQTGGKPQPHVADNKKVQTTKKDKELKPARLPSAFSKRSPIVKNQKVVTPTKEVVADVSSDDDEDYMSEEEAGTPESIKPATTTTTQTVYDPEKDAPFSPTLREILGHGKKSDNVKDKVKPTTSQRNSTSSTAAPRKKKSSAKAPPPSPLETPKTAEIPIDNGSVSKDLDSHKLPELRNLAKARGLKGYSKLKKSELVDLLKSSES